MTKSNVGTNCCTPQVLLAFCLRRLGATTLEFTCFGVDVSCSATYADLFTHNSTTRCRCPTEERTARSAFHFARSPVSKRVTYVHHSKNTGIYNSHAIYYGRACRLPPLYGICTAPSSPYMDLISSFALQQQCFRKCRITWTARSAYIV